MDANAREWNQRRSSARGNVPSSSSPHAPACLVTYSRFIRGWFSNRCWAKSGFSLVRCWVPSVMFIEWQRVPFIFVGCHGGNGGNTPEHGGRIDHSGPVLGLRFPGCLLFKNPWASRWSRRWHVVRRQSGWPANRSAVLSFPRVFQEAEARMDSDSQLARPGSAHEGREAAL
jgi:hypothetical protein